MNETTRFLSIAVALAAAFGFFIAGAFAGTGRARSLLGKRMARFDTLDSETLARAVRATYWGPPGIVLAIVVGVLYAGMFLLASQFRGRIWIGLVIAAAIGVVVARLQELVMRSAIERSLERRLTP